jgi:hypothetical protein
MALYQKIKIFTIEHPELLELRVNEWLEVQQEVNKHFEVLTTEITSVHLYNQQFIICCIRYCFLEAKI